MFKSFFILYDRSNRKVNIFHFLWVKSRVNNYHSRYVTDFIVPTLCTFSAWILLFPKRQARGFVPAKISLAHYHCFCSSPSLFPIISLRIRYIIPASISSVIITLPSRACSYYPSILISIGCRVTSSIVWGGCWRPCASSILVAIGCGISTAIVWWCSWRTCTAPILVTISCGITTTIVRSCCWWPGTASILVTVSCWVATTIITTCCGTSNSLTVLVAISHIVLRITSKCCKNASYDN